MYCLDRPALSRNLIKNTLVVSNQMIVVAILDLTRILSVSCNN